jgi:caa(3)-type oxidase subunit IV
VISALRPHLLPFLDLLIFLGATACAAYAPLGFINLPLSLVFSSIKTFIVAYFFMELSRADVLLRIVSLVGLIWLSILLMLILTDYLTRFAGLLLS